MWILFSIFGLLIAVRTFNVCESLRVFPKKYGEILAIFISTSILALNFFLRKHLWLQMTLLLVLFLLPFLLSRAIFFRREAMIFKNFVSILDSIIVKMRMGSSLRESLLQASESQDASTRFLLQEFVSLLSFDRPLSELVRHPQLQKIFLELQRIDRQPFRATERLKSLRRRLQVEKKLRQKSRRALLSARAQAVILSAMYLALLAYTLWKYGTQGSGTLILISTSLFSSGAFWLWHLGRGFQWKT
jgi:hypothetical protein